MYMYVVTYYIVFAMRNESTMVNSKIIQIVYYCLTLQCMIQLFMLFDRHEVRLMYIDINIDIVYLKMSSQNDPIAQSVRALV